MKGKTKQIHRSVLWRVLLIAALAALLFTVFAVTAAADTNLSTGTLTLNNVSQPRNNVQNTKTVSLSGNAAAHLTVSSVKFQYRRDGALVLTDVNDYLPEMADNENDVKLRILVRPDSGYVWKNGDWSLYPMTWNGQTVVGTKAGTNPDTTCTLLFVFDTYVAGPIELIDLSVPVPAAGSLSDNTVESNQYGWKLFYLSSGYPKWSMNGSSTWGAAPEVWQGGTRARISITVLVRSGCTLPNSLKVKLNGTEIPRGTLSDTNYFFKADTNVNIYYEFEIPDTLNKTVDLSSGPTLIAGNDAIGYVNTFCALAGQPASSAMTNKKYEIDLNNDSKNDLTLDYYARTASFPASVTITQGPGLFLAIGRKTEKTLTLTMDQQKAYAEASRIFWQTLNLKIATPRVTLDPDGGTWKNGTTAPITIATDENGELTLSMLSAYMSDQASENYGLKNGDKYAMGFALKGYTTIVYNSPGSLCNDSFTEDKEYKVVWKAPTTVTLDPNGGKLADGTATPVTLKCDRYNKLTGYEQYLTNASDYGVKPAAGYGFSHLAFAPDGVGSVDPRTYSTYLSGSTLYVVWYKIIKLTIDPNGGKFPDGTTAPKTYELDKSHRMSYKQYQDAQLDFTVLFTREGYVMSGLSESKDGPAVCDNDGLKKYLGDEEARRFEADTTLYIRWVRAITVTLDLSGGKYVTGYSNGPLGLAEGPITFVAGAGEKCYINGHIPSYVVRPNDQPVGWATEPGGKTAAVSTDLEAFITPDQDTTLYLIWETPSVLQILHQPRNVVKNADGTALYYGGNVVFGCFAAGKGVRYQWQYDNSFGHSSIHIGLPHWQDMPGETGPTLTVKAGYEDHVGRAYRCLVTDEKGAELSSNAVFCEPCFIFIEAPDNYTGQPGETAVFRVQVSAPAPTYEWHIMDPSYNEVDLASIPGVKGADTAEMTVPITAGLDKYLVYCKVHDTKLDDTISTYESTARIKVGKGINEIAAVLSPLPQAGDTVGAFDVVLPADLQAPKDLPLGDASLYYRFTDEKLAEQCRKNGTLPALNAHGLFTSDVLSTVKATDTFAPGVYLLLIPMEPKEGAGSVNRATLKVTFNGKELVKDVDWYSADICVAYVLIDVAAPHTHKLEKVNEVAATCAKPGTKAYWKCTECGKLFADDKGATGITAPETVPATGKHTWDLGEVTKAPTVTAEGEKTYKCLVCGTAKTEKIPKLDPEDPTPPAEPDYLLGDVDNDGFVRAADARLALRAAVRLESYEPGTRAFKAADVNMDNQITSADARLILRKSVGFTDKEFGVRY